MTILATWPASLPFPSDYEWALQGNTLEFAGALSGVQQTTELPNPRWMMTARWEVLVAEHAAALEAWYATMRGRAGRVDLYPMHRYRPRGTMSAAQVDGASQIGATLNVKNAGAGATLLVGDFIGLSIGGVERLFMLTENATADGTGDAALSIAPPIIAGNSPADSAALTLTKPTSRFMLADDRQGIGYRPGLIGSASVSLIEAFA